MIIAVQNVTMFVSVLSGSPGHYRFNPFAGWTSYVR